MRARDGYGLAAIDSTNDDVPFQLEGGVYTLDAVIAGSQTLQLQRLMPDGATYAGLHTALAATGTTGAVYCVKGTYRVHASTTDTSVVSVARVPGE